MTDDAPWLTLGEAAERCDGADIWPSVLKDILISGRVPVRAKRGSSVRADPIDDVLKRVGLRLSSLDLGWRVSFALFENKITLNLDRFLPDHRELAVELAQQPPLRETLADVCRHILTARHTSPFDPVIAWEITFTAVVVHWPKCIEELQAAGFQISRQQTRTRGSYKSELEAFLDEIPHGTGMSNDAIAGQFISRMEEREKRGEPGPRLPKRRYIETQVEKLRPKVEGRRARHNNA